MLFGKNSFFGGRSPRQFNYKPVYWDPEKEEAQAKARMRAKSPEGEKLSLLLDYKRDLRRSKRKTYNLRIFIIVILLLLFFIFLT
ncbi:MAG: hypothetical protein IPG60_01395 [Bacteroidetes bacterium]|nr:hypothetical protein [Bacteroidota bacterium]MBP7398143.1 hypothetical protein [Chitinophagales bacterium]MBK8486418.1 hypothetical protein [Bacteroidota bacterium]MBK8683198.1 hypothetical protein [Bacteroidota bacterium]MBP8753129.1 hypothetical protein [Chitinophagales bacterium]